MMKVTNMKSARTGVKVANQFIIENTQEKIIAFQSYDSLCAEVSDNGNTLALYPSFDYSRTTAKYCNAFITDYFNGNADKAWKLAKSGQTIIDAKEAR